MLRLPSPRLRAREGGALEAYGSGTPEVPLSPSDPAEERPAVLLSAAAESAASPDVLWALLTDLAGHRPWDPFTPWIRGELAPGRLLLLVAWIGPVPVPMVERVEAVDPGREVVWGTTWPLGLLAARRVQRLEPRADGGCTYRTHERFTGLLAPLVDRLVGRLVTRGFQATADGLARAAEEPSAVPSPRPETA